jgi:hypothetical protein
VASRWEVERALVWSNIRPMARLLVFALATKANAETGVIPDEHTPSLSTLAEMTGMARCVIPGHLKYLDGLGWVKLSTPAKRSKHDRNLYALMVGNPDPTRPSGLRDRPLDAPDEVDSGLPDGPLGAVGETDRSDTAETDPAVCETDRSNDTESARQTADDQPSGLSDRHATTTTRTKNKRTTTPRKARTAKAPSSSSSSTEADDPNAGLILKGWIDYCTDREIKLHPRTIGHYAKEIKTALDAKFPVNQIKKALAEMFAQAVTSSPSQLPKFLIEVQTGPRKWPARAAPEIYHNPVDHDDYDDWTRNAPPASK